MEREIPQLVRTTARWIGRIVLAAVGAAIVTFIDRALVASPYVQGIAAGLAIAWSLNWTSRDRDAE